MKYMLAALPHVNMFNDVERARLTTGMIPFNRMQEAVDWVKKNSRGEVGVVQANARVILNPWCDGDMRVVEIFSCGRWV